MAKKVSTGGKPAMDWHRMFGLMLTDFFTGSPFAVDMEKDLSRQKQFLDVVILRKDKGEFAERLPDGLDDLLTYNLVTFKSHSEALDDWTLKELTGHYVNFRKQCSPRKGPLLPEKEFRLYAVCCRYPHNLANVVTLEQVRPGVYQCRRGSDLIRIVVVAQLPQAEHNAPLHLFSGSEEQVAWAVQHYRQRSEETSTLLQRLVQGYRQEGLAVPYTMDDFRRDYVKEHLDQLSPEERLQGLPPEDRVKDLSLEQLEQLEKAIQQRREREASEQQKKTSRQSRRPRKS